MDAINGKARILRFQQLQTAIQAGKVPAMLHAALVLSPELELIASPWSAPAWMKDSGSLVWGALLGEPGGPQYRAWANYLCRFITEYAARGVRVRWLTVQNEPTFSLVTRFTVRGGTRCSRMQHGTVTQRMHHIMHHIHHTCGCSCGRTRQYTCTHRAHSICRTTAGAVELDGSLGRADA